MGNSADLCRLVRVVALTVLALILSGATSALAFHNDSTFSCFGCHNDKPSDHIYNLIGTDQSSTCLRCHQRKDRDYLEWGDHYICTPDDKMPTGLPPLELTPGGDFGWLKKDYVWKNEEGVREYSSGQEHGHNIVAADFGYAASYIFLKAPGGEYPSSALHCTSCHDPHGTYRRNWDGSISTDGPHINASGSYNDSPDPDINSSVSVYRMLGGMHYQPKSLNGEFMFKNDPPAAVSPSHYNRPEALTQTRVAYGAGMSEWCRNCHLNYSTKGHRAGNTVAITNQMAKLYNSYSSGDSPLKSYLSLVPFEVGSTDYALLKKLATNDDSQLQGPVSANVSCLSCHRAHASGWKYGLRFNYGVRWMTVVDSSGNAAYPDPSKDPVCAQGHSIAETKKAYYDREATRFGARRGPLCSKCHAKD
jgi:hypothetical protein